MADSEFWFFDLSLVIAYTGGVTLVILAGLGGPLRIALAIPLVILLPGYAFVSIFYPDEATGRVQRDSPEGTSLINTATLPQGLNTIERLVFSVVFSVAITPAVATVVSFSPWGITVQTVVLGLGLTTLVLAVLGIISRWRCPPDRRLAFSRQQFSVLLRSGRGPLDRRPTRAYNTALILSLVLLAVAVGYALVAPPQHDGFTELYVETEEVTAETDVMYQASYTQGETSPLALFIGNQEHRDTTYSVVVLLQAVTYGDDGVTVDNEEELARDEVRVSNGETREITLEITPTFSGDDMRLLVLLYTEEPPDDPSEETAYRTLRLPVEVS